MLTIHNVFLVYIKAVMILVSVTDFLMTNGFVTSHITNIIEEANVRKTRFANAKMSADVEKKQLVDIEKEEPINIKRESLTNIE